MCISEVGVTPMITLSAEKCPSDTVEWPYECWFGILCGGDYKGLPLIHHVIL